MRIQSRIFPHTPRATTAANAGARRLSDKLAYEISEAVYEVFRELTTVAFQAAQRAYPREKRDRDGNVEDAYQAAHAEAKSCMTGYKTLVRDKILPLMRIKKHSKPYDFYPTDFSMDAAGKPLTRHYEDRPTWQARGMVVLNAYFRLHKDLRHWVPPMPKEEAERYVRILDAKFEDGRERLLEFLSYFEFDPVLPEDGSHINITE